jgi:hypothetical protein
VSKIVRTTAGALIAVAVGIGTVSASNFKTVCASGCDYTDLQSAINGVPTRSVPGDGASSPWVIQVQIGVLAVGSSLTVDGKSYLTIEGIGRQGTFVQAAAGWFSNATSAPAEQFLTISNSDHVTLRNIAIDASTNAPSNLTINQSGGGIAGVFVQHVDPLLIDNVSITAYEWGLRDANPGPTDPANANNIQVTESRIKAQYIASWVAGGSTWLVWNSEFRGQGDLTANSPPTVVEGLYVTGAFPAGARNVFTAWGTHLHAESPGGGNIRAAELDSMNTSDVTAFVGCTIHAKTTGTSTVNVEAMYSVGSSHASVDVSGSEIIYEGAATITSGVFVAVFNNFTYVTYNLTGTSIIDRARDDSTNPPTLAGSTHKDVLRSQGASGSRPSAVHLVGSRGVSMTGHSSSVPQSLDTVECQAGTTSLAGGTATVTLPAALPSSKYRVAISVNANETVWVSSKSATTFTLQSSNSSSTATVDWIVRF